MGGTVRGKWSEGDRTEVSDIPPMTANHYRFPSLLFVTTLSSPTNSFIPTLLSPRPPPHKHFRILQPLTKQLRDSSGLNPSSQNSIQSSTSGRDVNQFGSTGMNLGSGGEAHGDEFAGWWVGSGR